MFFEFVGNQTPLGYYYKYTIQGLLICIPISFLNIEILEKFNLKLPLFVPK
jgi:hypothetical protein